MISGVEMVELKRVVNERGHLCEVQRNDDSHFPGFGQAYVTCTRPGVIRAWYRHHRQLDQLALITGELLLVLYDDRVDSPSSGEIQQIVVRDERPLLIQIPRGIWHGFKAVGSEALYLLHLNTIPFHFADPDEERLPPDSPMVPYDWDRQ